MAQAASAPLASVLCLMAEVPPGPPGARYSYYASIYKYTALGRLDSPLGFVMGPFF